MKYYLGIYGASLGAFLALDMVWLSLMGPRLYRPLIGPLLADQFAITPAVLFYLLYGVGLVVFGVLPAAESGKPLMALFYGGLFGLIAYGTYDLTNQSTLRDWPLAVTLADMVWGAVATGLASVVGLLVASFLSRP
jgi:uncharacterized membrane protein